MTLLKCAVRCNVFFVHDVAQMGFTAMAINCNDILSQFRFGSSFYRSINTSSEGWPAIVSVEFGLVTVKRITTSLTAKMTAIRKEANT